MALWAGVVDVNSGGDGKLPNDGDIRSVWVLGMVAEVMPVPQQCSAAIKAELLEAWLALTIG